VIAVEIGLPPARPGEASAALITREWVAATLPRRTPHGHKGGAGTLAVLAGHPGMGGAAILVAMGALRAGCGKVRSVSCEENRLALQTAVPEGLFVDRDGEGVEGVIESADALVVGPGMGTDSRARDLLRLALARATGPLLLDADAITLVASEPGLLDGAPTSRMLVTPHPGEMSRLLGTETRAIVADPFGAAAAAAHRLGCAVLLKGAPSVVAAPGEPALVNVAGHSGIATSGMGDTLAGVIGALLAVGSPPREAAAMGLFVAGRAAEALGPGRPLLPRDVAEALPAALALEPAPGRLALPEVRLDLPAAR
jgi:NAD(P)H-hydrate epimerase